MRRDAPTLQWARVKGQENRGLRRGAWYRVLALTPAEAVLDVNRRRKALPLASLQVVDRAPQAWTVVPLPPDAKGLAAKWKDRYVVCPSCRNRAAVRGAPQSKRCPRCHGVFRVAWDDWFIGTR